MTEDSKGGAATSEGGAAGAPVPAMADARVAAMERAQRCMQEVQRVLRAHDCELRTRVEADPVGNGRLLVESRWFVVPL